MNAQQTMQSQATTLWVQKRILGLSRHWLAWSNGFWGALNGLPWLAPVFMHVGAVGLARTLYTLYSALCHQLANRSFFLFGPRATYAYTDLLPFASSADTYLGLRVFVGTPGLGYKVAWSDRMVSLYGGFLLGGIAFALLRRRLKTPRWWMLLLVVPIVVDGGTHMISDLSGVGQGFRYANAWLSSLTGGVLPSDFYAGTQLGSFNSLMRLITGLLAGMGVTLVLYPLLDNAFAEIRRTLEARFAD
jgi:uncharacterized membrane protein